MQFLPIESNGERVYAGFWRRLCAAIVDVLLMIPFAWLYMWLMGYGGAMTIVAFILYLFLPPMYSVYFNARFGGTLGKLAVGIRITKPNGTRIGWLEAWKRSSVDIVLIFPFLAVSIWTIMQADINQYASLSLQEQMLFLHQHAPSWNWVVGALGHIWFWSELLVLLTNKRKRALHDFIAGTVVIKKQFTVPSHPSEQPQDTPDA